MTKPHVGLSNGLPSHGPLRTPGSPLGPHLAPQWPPATSPAPPGWNVAKKSNVKWSKKFAPRVPGERQVLASMGKLALIKLRNRITRDGKDAHGRPLPELDGDGRYFTSATDPRFDASDGMEPRYQRGHTGGGKPTLKVRRDGYRALKKDKSGKTRRGQSLTGAMWKAVKIAITSKKDAQIVRLHFGGSQRVGKSSTETTKSGKPKTVSVRNRDKAVRLQYAQRDKQGNPKGPKQFTLMELSAKELGKLRDFYLSKIRLFQ